MTRTKSMTPFAHRSDPFIICPYYTGRDKGPLIANGGDDNGAILTFFSEGHAWRHILTVVQPDDERACTNYRVVRLSEWEHGS